MSLPNGNTHGRLILLWLLHQPGVPGRKTDVKDAEWISKLFRHGLLKASFIQYRGVAYFTNKPLYRPT